MGKRETKRTKLSPAEVRKFEAMLLAKRDEILGNVTSMESEALRRERSDLSNLPIHMADLGTDNYEIENIIGLMSSERKMLSDIDEALSRIEAGTYGTCEGNGEPTPKARLNAIPWARYCLACTTLMEKSLLTQREDNGLDLSYRDESTDDT
ncbi:MAG: TraR/DksA C4-type zinc finger protein [Phycisphaerales bacterium]|nr:MAG: TraR/DksA C4-type zinc finger protein [Phycisphaerales bacterium]